MKRAHQAVCMIGLSVISLLMVPAILFDIIWLIKWCRSEVVRMNSLYFD